MAFDPNQYRAVLGIAREHTLELADSRVVSGRSVERESHLLHELDTEARLIARYRVWIHACNLPPYRHQRGWERYTPDGRLLDREVRYSEQPDGRILH